MPVAAPRANLLASGTQRTMPFTPTLWFAVAYGNGAFVAPGYASTYAARSTDGGLTWSQVTLPASRNWTAITTDGAGTWVCIADGTTAGAISTDNGATWSAGTAPSNGTCRTLSYSNGVYFAAYNATGTAYRSTNGSTWSPVTMPGTRDWKQAEGNGSGTWVVTASDTVTPTWFAYSTDDAQTFSKSGATGSTSYSLAYLRNQFLSIGSTGAYSTNGSAWTTVAYSTIGIPDGAATGNGVAISPTYTAAGTATCFVSYDGSAIGTFSLPAARSWSHAAYGAGRFVVVVQANVNYCYTVDLTFNKSNRPLSAVSRAAVF